jgi:hypothetical protein
MTTTCTEAEEGSERADKPVVSASLGVERIGRELSRDTEKVRL